MAFPTLNRAVPPAQRMAASAPPGRIRRQSITAEECKMTVSPVRIPSRMLRIAAAFGLPAALSLAAGDVLAVQFCAENAAQLKAHLATAAGNGFTDLVKIRSGTYEPPVEDCLPETGCFAAVVTDGAPLSISGGWDAACQNQSFDPSDRTTLSGRGAFRALYLVQNYDAMQSVPYVENLELVNGAAPAFGKGGCGLFENPVGDLLVSKLTVRSCIAAAGEGGGVHARAKRLVVRDSLFVDNVARWGAGLHVFVGGIDTAWTINNTIADNLSESGGSGTGGLHVSGTGGLSYHSNNIIHGNDAGTDRYDIGRGSVFAQFRHTLYGSTQYPLSGMGNFIADPQFTGSSNYRPLPTSIARNAGTNHPDGGIAPTDLVGNPRIANDIVDLGAYEVAGESSHLLIVSVAGTGAGLVTSSPAGISCGDDAAACAVQFPSGTQVQLTALAGPDSSFQGWTGACAGQAATCVLTMTMPRVTAANFSSGDTIFIDGFDPVQD
jgi:hypothetical protein